MWSKEGVVREVGKAPGERSKMTKMLSVGTSSLTWEQLDCGANIC